MPDEDGKAVFFVTVYYDSRSSGADFDYEEALCDEYLARVLIDYAKSNDYEFEVEEFGDGTPVGDYVEEAEFRKSQLDLYERGEI